MKCRHCSATLENVFLDLGNAPPSNAYLTQKALSLPEVTYPLKLYVCSTCWLVQTIDYASSSELFSDSYAYFSSTSISWLEYSRLFSIDIARRLNLNSSSYVIEVASNDGYLLKNFLQAGIPCLGIEPTESTAKVAEKVPSMAQ